MEYIRIMRVSNKMGADTDMGLKYAGGIGYNIPASVFLLSTRPSIRLHNAAQKVIIAVG